MAVTIENYTYNVVQSFYYWLNNTTYTKGGVTKTLKDHFNNPQLDIILGFPPALQELKLPTLAVVLQPIEPKDVTTFRNQYDSLTYSFIIYGFCGSESTYELNQLQRDKICNDVRSLIEETEYIDIYTVSETPIASDFAIPLTDVEVVGVSSQNINPTGVTVADRYRFSVSFDLIYNRSTLSG